MKWTWANYPETREEYATFAENEFSVEDEFGYEI